MKIIVCGGRDFGLLPTERDLIFQTLNSLHTKYPITFLAEGAAKGADSVALEWRIKNGIPGKRFPADWYPDGRISYKRNAEMLKEVKPELVVAFPGGNGTQDMKTRAKLQCTKLMEISLRESNNA